jgi:hypothetical protein
MAENADARVEREIDEAVSRAENPRKFTVELESCFEDVEDEEMMRYCEDMRGLGATELSTLTGPNGWPCIMVTGTLEVVLRCLARHYGHWHDMTVEDMVEMVTANASDLGLE